MNANSFKIMKHKRNLCPQLWVFKYGFGIWIGRMQLTVGHDIRSGFVTKDLPRHESIDHMAGSMTADILRARNENKQ